MSEKTEQELKEEFRKRLVKSKLADESYVVLSIYKASELLDDIELEPSEFDSLEWKFYFSVAKKLFNDGKRVFDDIVVGLCVSENEHLQKMYEEFGGWETIQQGIGFVEEDNFDSYVTSLKKTNALIRLHDLGFPVMKNFDAYKAQSVESIQENLEKVLATAFSGVDTTEKVEDMSKGLWQTVMDAHEGKNRGFPYTSALLNQYVNGMSLGSITMVSGNSGTGKTAFTLMQVLPNMIKYNERLLILANEEDSSKWKREIITWAVNNIIEGGDFQKNRFNQGSFSKEELALLKKGVDWLEEKMEDGTIRFINFNSFSMSRAIKMIKKEIALNSTKYFVLDTLKLDSDAVSQNTQAWLQLQQNMVHLHDLIKPSNRNVHVYVTYQLGKSALLTRYLSQNSLGVSKNVTDVVSVLILFRKVLESEKSGGKNELSVKTNNGKIIKLDKGKEYFVLFIDKNRFGETYRQLVFEVDLGRNKMTEIGTTLIEQDF